MLAASGVSEITLLGQNVNSYGRDITRRRPLFADLLRAVGRVEGIERIRYTSPHPQGPEPRDDRGDGRNAGGLPAAASPAAVRLGPGVEGDAPKLQVDRYVDRLARARAAIDDLAVTTDLIVGFPGESDADFDETLEVVAACEFDSGLHLHLLAARRNEGRVDERTVHPRGRHQVALRAVKKVLDRSALRKHEARVGRVKSARRRTVTTNERMLSDALVRESSFTSPKWTSRYAPARS